MSSPAKGPMSNSKDQMSRALGAAFLGHQVAQLESKVNTGAGSNGPRDGRGRGHRGGGRTWNPSDSGGNASRGSRAPRGGRGSPPHQKPGDLVRKRSFSLHPDPARTEPVQIKEREKPVMANVIVLDASVLVHGLGQVKRWCKDERKEILIVPLEALNTLDLLKKGGNTIAIHARAASRFLEAQVGTNPRVRVQRDEDFVPWDEMYSSAVKTTEIQLDKSAPAATVTDDKEAPVPVVPPEEHAPEWMRQTVCCTEWERKRANAGEGGEDTLFSSTTPGNKSHKKTVALAIIKPIILDSTAAAVLDVHDPTLLKHIPRASGDLLRVWAPIFNIKVLNIEQGTTFDTHSHSRSSDKSRGFTAASDGISSSFRSRGGSNRASADETTRGLVDKSKDRSPFEAVAGVGKIRLLARGEKLDP